MKKNIFIHTNNKQYIGSLVSAYSIKKYAKKNDFNITILHTDDYQILDKHHGDSYLREGNIAKWDSDDLQSFTPLRFLPPSLMNFQGRAIVIDPDIFSLKDINNLFEMDMKGKSILAREIFPKDGRKSYFASSVMLLDCSKLRHWNFSNYINLLFKKEIDYRDLMSLYLEDKKNIGVLGEEWNHFDTLNHETCLLHNTGRLTQPWKSGLKVDFKSNKFKKRTLKQFIKDLLRLKLTNYYYYRDHPDPNQIEHFFSLVNESIASKAISPELIEKHISWKNLRTDFFDILKKYE